MIRADKILGEGPPENFAEWNWGDGDEESVINAFRVSTAEVIAEQIKCDCEAWLCLDDGHLSVTIWDDFIIVFDVIKALDEAAEDIEIDLYDTDALEPVVTRLENVVKKMRDQLTTREKEEGPPCHPQNT